jgi:mono/diheme cytochrome c family protein
MQSTNMRIVILLVSALLVCVSISSCRGWTSEKPPVHVNPNMDTQNKYKPYRESEFFADKRDMRPNVEGTVARGKLKDDDHFYRGKLSNGDYVSALPPQVPLTIETLHRGRDRFGIYCSPCHGLAAGGDGMVGKKIGMEAAPRMNLHRDAMHQMPIGYFFHVMTEGVDRMKPYRDKLNEADRWAIAAYVRALQVSQDSEGAWITKTALGK